MLPQDDEFKTKLLDFIDQYRKVHGKGPSMSEVAAALGIKEYKDPESK